MTKTWYDELVKEMAHFRQVKGKLEALRAEEAVIARYGDPKLVRGLNKEVTRQENHLSASADIARILFEQIIKAPLAAVPVPPILHPVGVCPYCGGQPGDYPYHLTECCHRPLNFVYYDGKLRGYEETVYFD